MAMFLPLLYVIFSESRSGVRHSLLFVAASMSLPIAWYSFVYQTIQTHDNVLMHIFMQLHAGKVLSGNVLLNPEYYKRLFDLVTGYVLASLLFPFALFGLIILRSGREKWFAWTWLVTFLIVMVVLPKKVIDHDFYLYPNFLILFVLVAIGIDRVLASSLLPSRKWFYVSLTLIYLVMSGRYFFNPLYTYPVEDEHVLAAARSVREIVPEDEWIIAGQAGAPDLFIYSDRRGWTVNETDHGPNQMWEAYESQLLDPEEYEEKYHARLDPVRWLEYLKNLGASYFVVSDKRSLQKNKQLHEHVTNEYQLVSGPDDPFYLFRLTSKPSP